VSETRELRAREVFTARSWPARPGARTLEAGVIHIELRRPGVTLRLLQKEYLQAHPMDTATRSTSRSRP
jgi:hypothetical protein